MKTSCKSCGSLTAEALLDGGVCNICRKHVLGKELLNIKQAALILNTTPGNLQKMVQHGEITHIRYNARPKFDPKDIEAWKEKRKVVALNRPWKRRHAS